MQTRVPRSPARSPSRGAPSRPEVVARAHPWHLPRIRELLWLLPGLAGVIAQLWTCRGAPVGTPAADDYLFLAEARFHDPVDFFGPMGAPLYWRPVARQLYFLALGPWMVEHPWIVAAVHLTLLLLLYGVLFRTLRGPLGAWPAAAAAMFPMLAEPTRVLVSWPSGAQHLLAMLGAAVAVHECLARRPWTAAAAAAAGILSHESAALVLPVIAVVGGMRAPSRREAWVWPAFAVAIACLVLAGHAVAHSHGAGLPTAAGGAGGEPLFRVIGRALWAQLNLEDVRAGSGDFMAVLAWAPLALALATFVSRRARTRLRERAAIALAGAAWFLLGAAALVTVLPDWNSWRSVLPGVGLGVALATVLGAAHPRWAMVWAAARLLSLLLVPAAPREVVRYLPPATSRFSFARLAQIQRLVESTRRILTAGHPSLPPGAAVRFGDLPAMTEVGFQGPAALRVWYSDSTLRWEERGGFASLDDPPAAVVEYLQGAPWPAQLASTEVVRQYLLAIRRINAGDLAAADSLLTAAQAGQRDVRGGTAAALHHAWAHLALLRRNPALADSHNQRAYAANGLDAEYWAMTAMLALLRGDRERAAMAADKSLRLEPNQSLAVRVAAALRQSR